MPGRTTRKTGRRTTAAAQKRGNALSKQVDFARELSGWANDVPVAPPQTAAMTWNEFLTDLSASLAKIAACAKMGQTLDAINDHLNNDGNQMSQQEYDNWNQQGEDMFEDMVNMGC